MHGKREQALAIGLSALFHLVALTLLASAYREMSAPGEVQAIEVLLVDPLRRHRLAAEGPTRQPLTPSARRPLVFQPAETGLVQSEGAAPSVTPAPAVSASVLRGALRRGLDCESSLLSREEREACLARFARNLASAPRLPLDVDPAKQAYYAAVAAAKAPGGAWDDGHGPKIGCKIVFGLGAAKVVRPPHSIGIGPCFIAPPRGPLTPDVDVPPL